MEYRKLGKIDREVSIIGLGAEYLDLKPYEQVKATIDFALDQGINIMDLFMPGREVRKNIAKALEGKRDKMMVQGHLGSTDISMQYNVSRDMPTVKRYFEDLLQIFDGYIDFGMLYFIDSEATFKRVFETEFADYAATLKAQGRIGYIGFSSHNPVIAMKVINTGLPEMVMFSINPVFDRLPTEGNETGSGLLHGIDSKRVEFYSLCEKKQIGINVMKTFCSGKLISPLHSPFSRALTTDECIHYVLSTPAVSSALIGCKTPEEVDKAVGYLNAKVSEDDYKDVLDTLREGYKGSCVYCSHCQPCPVEIDVASVMRFLDMAKLDEKNIPPIVFTNYQGLDSRGGDCIACGDCEERCPFHVPVIKNMAEADRLLGR